MTAVTLGKFEQVAGTFAQAGQRDRDDVEPVKQILAEAPRLHLFGEIAVGRGDDAHVGAAGRGLPHPLVFALLEEAEQFGLDGERQFADLVEKKRATGGGGDLAHRIGDRPGEGALHVAEEFALEQFAGERRAIDGDESRVALGAAAVELTREHALAGATGAEQQNARGAVGGLERHGERPLHHGLAGEHRERRRLGGQIALKRPHPLLENGGFLQLGEHRANLVRSEGLGDKVKGPEPHRLDGGGDVGVGGEHHDGRSRPGLQHASERFEAAVGAEIEIEEDRIKGFLGDRLQRPRRRGGLGGRVAGGLQGDARGFPDRGFVVDDENAHGGERRRRKSGKPRPGRSRDPARSSFNLAPGGPGPHVADEKDRSWKHEFLIPANRPNFSCVVRRRETL